MRALGFNEKWNKLVMFCVSSVSFSVLVNEQPGTSFIPSRGLRQGYPLSPYLFLFCVEYLNSMLTLVERMRDFTSLSTTKKGTIISHLFFTDDNMLFCKATKEEWNRVKTVLDLYERGSRQMINKQKSSLLFSSNTLMKIRETMIQEVEGVIYGSAYLYLGLPFLIGWSKYNTFLWIKERVWNKMSNWKHKSLSQVGRKILIKVVIQALPMYTMSIFQPPKKLCNDLSSILAKFWLGNK